MYYSNKIEEGELLNILIHWPQEGALPRQQHALINGGPHTGSLSGHSGNVADGFIITPN